MNFKKIAKSTFSYMLAGMITISGMSIKGESIDTVYAADETVSYSTWECIEFGHYWQNDTNGDGVADTKDEKQPIVWRILEKTNNTVLLLADQNLDAMPFNESGIATWENCSLRNWLNSTFLNEAFTETEQNAIQNSTVFTQGDVILETADITTIDKVYVPSAEDVTNSSYGFYYDYRVEDDNRVVSNTAYTGTKPFMYTGGSADAYSLRTEGQYHNIRNVHVNGLIGFHTPQDTYSGVRPMLQLDISNTSIWSSAGNVTAKHIDTIGDFNPSASKENNTDDKDDTSKENNADNKNDTSKTNQETADAGNNKTNNTENAEQTKENPVRKDSANQSVYKINSNTTTKNDNYYNVKPSMVSKVSLKNLKSKKIRVTWKWQADVDKFQVQYALNRTFTKSKKTKTVSGYSESKTISGLKKGKTYYVRVRGYKNSSYGKIYGKWSAVKKVKIKK